MTRPAAREVVAVFARFPEPGRVKTRLIPRLGAEGAARLYQRVAEHTLAEVRALRRPSLRRVAWIAPAARADDAARWIGEGFEIAAQPEGDLGARMSAAVAAAFAAGAGRVVVVGSDLPGLTAAHLDAAFEALTAHDAVLGPAHDGGYWLIGLARPLPAFAGIPWSSPDTLAATLRVLEAYGARTAVLDELRDLDTPADLDALRPSFPGLLG